MSRQIGDELNAALDVSVVDADFSGILHSGLSVADRRRVLVEWNDTSRDLGGEFCLHRLVESQAAATPEAVAVVCGDVALSYALLNRRANRLAHQLRSHGVGPEALVALFAERSLAMVVGLLGILKAGGAYVPLDPDYPRERVSLMLGDAAPRVVLTQEHLKNQLPDGPWPVLSIDDEVASASDEFDWNPETGVQPENLAYVIYTSGSTGMPKGVLNTHVGICNRLLWMRDAYGLSQRDRVLQKTPFSFDVSVWEFFAPLVSGGRLVLARPGGHRDPSYLARLVEDAAINIIHFVPSMLQAFLDEPGLLKSCRSLEHLFTSGEALPEGIARRALKLLPCRLHNLYGPTEAAVEVTFFECRADDPPGPIPIGKPIANMRAYVLDASFQPLPVGTAGELFLGGIGVARGYLNRPELTAERFVRDPFDDRPGARLYRTGDLAQWRADGNIEFLGRMDDQVKLRGFRIELGEIECALAQHADIRQATVLLREDEPGDPRLVAYFIADDVAPDSHQLRDFLAQTLPDHMVPTRFVRLSAFPLNANGKLDRRALPAPETGHSHDHQGFVPPRSPIEQSLASIWQDVLGVPAVGVYDDFFDLGGHSLRAMRLLARIDQELGVRLPISAVFHAGTIAAMASALEESSASPHPQTATGTSRGLDDPIVPLQIAGAGAPVFMVPGMLAHVISLRDLAILLGSDQPVYGLQPASRTLEFLENTTVEKLARELLGAMKRVAGRGPYHLLGFSAGGTIAYQMAQYLIESGEEVGLLGLLDTYGPGFGGILPLNVRIFRHVQLVGRMGPWAGLRYMLERSRARLERSWLFGGDAPALVTFDEMTIDPTATDPIAARWCDEVVGRHRRRPYLGRVDLFTADKPVWLGHDFEDPMMGWGPLVKGKIVTHRVPGDHLEMIKPPALDELAVKVRQALDEAADRVAARDGGRLSAASPVGT
jgi:amino acid adenylation domain-containing protein